MRYNHKKIEKKWQKKWEEEKLYQPDLNSPAKRPFYNLMMFPYPSAEGLHIGNMYAFVHSDAYGRFMRLKGFDVFEPIGLDGFGIHSENYAIKIGQHIKDVSARTEKKFYSQLRMIGNQYDWSRTVETYKPDYYKWTQWLFLKMYEKGLAYRKKSPVNWCPSCKTVLSNEQVIAGKCERCGAETGKRSMEQWFWKITDYAEKLLKNLDWIDWSEEVKIGQKNWIGRSEGALISFELKTKNEKLKTSLEVFTTRPDTLFGATYMVVCPEHEMLTNYKSCLSADRLQITNYKEIEDYINKARIKSDLERSDLAKEKTGLKIEGLAAINPINNKEIPIFAADYVLPDYGTGAIMAVPAHDERDWEFARKYGLEIKMVICPNYPKPICPVLENAYIGEGHLVGSGKFTGMESVKAKEEIIKWLIAKKLGKRLVQYKLRDWCISRQRYWGPPIPLVFCKNCKKLAENYKSQNPNYKQVSKSKFQIQNYSFSLAEIMNPGWVAVLEKELPVLLPAMEDFLPDGSGKGPLNKVEEFVNTICPKCGGPAKRETDVSDPFVDSSWYYLRYLDPHNKEQPFDKLRARKWMPVDMYIGGKEHTVLHLLYSRFVSMVLYELGYTPKEEPFKKFRAHGLLIREGAKISKSKGNIVTPDEYIEKFGADTVRLYLLFLGDMRQGGDWRDSGIIGVYRFLNRVYRLKDRIKKQALPVGRQESRIRDDRLERILHKTIKKVTADLEHLKFNTAIAQLMILSNEMEEARQISNEIFKSFLKLLAPFAPYLAEELWYELGNKKSIHSSKWPLCDLKKIEAENIELVIQVNGRFRGRVSAAKGLTQKEAENLVFSHEWLKTYTQDQPIRRIIFIADKLINIVN